MWAGKSAFYDVNVSQCPNTHYGHISQSIDLFHLIRVQHDAIAPLMGVSGMKMGKNEVKNPSLPRKPQDFDQKWCPLLQQNGGTQALFLTSTPRSINVTNVP